MEKKHCDKCGEPQYLEYGGNIYACICKCQAEERDKVAKAEEEKEENDKLQQRLNVAIPHRVWRESEFEKADNKEDKIYLAVKAYVDKFSQMLYEGKGIMFYGIFGGGKTFYQCCIANALVRQGYWVAMRNSAELITIFDSGRSKQISEVLEELSDVDIFILDDFGAERASDFAISKLYQIINTRINSGMPMIVSTNISMENMKNEKSASLKRIYERLWEHCLPIKIEGNRRTRNMRDNFTSMRKQLGLE